MRWESGNPPFQVTEQRLVDQARNIRKKGYLSTVELDALKAIIEEEMVRTETTEPSDIARSFNKLSPTSNDQHADKVIWWAIQLPTYNVSPQMSPMSRTP